MKPSRAEALALCRTALADWNGKLPRLEEVINSMAEPSAWAHLRSGGPCVNTVDEDHSAMCAGNPSRQLAPRMTNPTRRQQSPSRPPVDALQYERLALAAYHACDRQGQQLQHLITLATSMLRSPATTLEERSEHRNLLEIMIQTGQNYYQANRCDQELFTVLALDAKGLPQRQLKPEDATAILAGATEGVNAKLAAMDASWKQH
ncbi:hypothetical protein BH160DRAFT_1339 [Burkholderia sp. H160]|nr:hypothetical protein BH160DRAFT_1339 [Burkholderia sp. H160]